MTVFVDTSALLSFLDEDDEDHDRVVGAVRRLRDERRRLRTTSSVVVESVALVQRRIGVPAVRALRERLVPLLDVRWVERDLHEVALDALLETGRRRVSLVDHVSFVMMRREGIGTALTLDQDFAEQGFAIVP